MRIRTGLSPEGIERFRSTAERHVGDQLVPGLVALVAHGDEIHVEALGRLAIGGAPVSRDSLFRIASLSKPITAAATLALVDDGVLVLDQPVDELLPELADRRVLAAIDGPLSETRPALRPITVRDLLTFTFGFGMCTGMFRAVTPWPIVAAAAELSLDTIGPPSPGRKPDPDTWIANLGRLPLIAQPGERWLYNTGATVLSVLLERASGLTFGELLRERLFEPLGMRDTSFWTTEASRFATAYARGGDGELVAWDAPDGEWSRPPVLEDGAAGLVSTADDLLSFARMLLAAGAGVLSPTAVGMMTSDQLTPAQKAHGGLGPGFFDGKGWGFCLEVHDGGAYGWAGGFGTTWLVDPTCDLVVIVLGQRAFETSTPPQLHQELQDAAYIAARVRR